MKLDHAELMRFHDGELPPERAAVLEQALGRSAEAREVLAGLEQTGAALRSIAGEDPRGGLIADAVMARIAGERPMQVPAAPAGMSVWRRVAPAGAALVAMAAAAALFLRVGSHSPSPVTAHVALTVGSPAIEPVARSLATRAPGTPEAEEKSPAVAIESVDFGARGGTIFMVESGESETPVIWLVDDPGSSGGRMSPL